MALESMSWLGDSPSLLWKFVAKEGKEAKVCTAVMESVASG